MSAHLHHPPHRPRVHPHPPHRHRSIHRMMSSRNTFHSIEGEALTCHSLIAAIWSYFLPMLRGEQRRAWSHKKKNHSADHRRILLQTSLCHPHLTHHQPSSSLDPPLLAPSCCQLNSVRIVFVNPSIPTSIVRWICCPRRKRISKRWERLERNHDGRAHPTHINHQSRIATHHSLSSLPIHYYSSLPLRPSPHPTSKRSASLVCSSNSSCRHRVVLLVRAVSVLKCCESNGARRRRVNGLSSRVEGSSEREQEKQGEAR